ncbi:MAG: hypothetical protein H6767_05395 [Candidatus Peribacteria bacterium]|nr:MAG: hypothetical protein H6767_05395 [Candidatus Peribacteria bacterium]
MKQVFHDKIVNIAGSDVFDRKFLLRKIIHPLIPSFNSKGRDVETIHLSDLLEQRKNTDLLLKVKEKPAMYSNVYSPKDELEIFEEIFEDALKNQKRVHIVGITLKEEVMILEKYYEELGFFREDINVFQVDFSAPLVSVSVKIENLMWKGSDYKRMGEQIFFNPPIRESGQVKAMFSGINR